MGTQRKFGRLQPAPRCPGPPRLQVQRRSGQAARHYWRQYLPGHP
jgi:hypothetical protein